MSVLEQSQPQIKKFFMPSTPETLPDGTAVPEASRDWIMLDTRPFSVADSFEITDEDNSTLKRLARMYITRITSWSFTNKDGSALPVNMASIALLQNVDFDFIRTIKFAESAQPLTNTEKKT